MTYMDKFVEEREEALLSLYNKKIEWDMKKYQINWDPINETVFWAAVHNAILQLRSATYEQKMRSAEWLVNHGFKPYIY